MITKTDEKGQVWVAMVYRQPLDKNVFINGHGYTFTTNVVSCCWIMESDVPAMEQFKRVCCGGRTRNEFTLANQAQVNVWEGRKP